MIILDSGPPTTPGSLHMKEGGGDPVRKTTEWPVLGWEGSTSQECGPGQGTGVPLKRPEGSSPAPTLIGPLCPMLDFQPTG